MIIHCDFRQIAAIVVQVIESVVKQIIERNSATE